MAKQWRKNISLRQTQSRKLMLGFVHFGVYMIPLAVLVGYHGADNAKVTGLILV